MVETLCTTCFLFFICIVCYQLGKIDKYIEIKKEKIKNHFDETKNYSNENINNKLVIHDSYVYRDTIAITNKNHTDYLYFHKGKFYTSDEMYNLKYGNKKS